MPKHTQLIKKQDLFLILLILLVAAGSGVWYYLSHRTPGHRAEVTVNGVLVETIDLSKNQETTIHSTGGRYNHLIIEDGMIWCDDATCPDGVCKAQGKQSLDHSMIVCLPNAMIVTILED